MEKLKRYFGEFDMTWPRVLLLALVTAVWTAAMAAIPLIIFAAAMVWNFLPGGGGTMTLALEGGEWSCPTSSIADVMVENGNIVTITGRKTAATSLTLKMPTARCRATASWWTAKTLWSIRSTEQFCFISKRTPQQSSGVRFFVLRRNPPCAPSYACRNSGQNMKKELYHGQAPSRPALIG